MGKAIIVAGIGLVAVLAAHHASMVKKVNEEMRSMKDEFKKKTNPYEGKDFEEIFGELFSEPAKSWPGMEMRPVWPDIVQKIYQQIGNALIEASLFFGDLVNNLFHRRP